MAAGIYIFKKTLNYTGVKDIIFFDQVGYKLFKYFGLFIYTMLPKVLGSPPFNERFDNFSNFHEYKS